MYRMSATIRSSLLYKNIKIEICRNIILRVFYACVKIGLPKWGYSRVFKS